METNRKTIVNKGNAITAITGLGYQIISFPSVQPFRRDLELGSSAEVHPFLQYPAVMPLISEPCSHTAWKILALKWNTYMIP
jgi:hypothetical protein